MLQVLADVPQLTFDKARVSRQTRDADRHPLPNRRLVHPESRTDLAGT
jgi:hypothetical protein